MGLGVARLSHCLTVTPCKKVDFRGRRIQLFVRLTHLFREWGLRLSPHLSPWSKKLGRFRNGESRRCVQLRDLVVPWMRSSALLTCTRAVFPEVSEELHAGKEWRVLCARRWTRAERIMGLECEAALCHGYAQPPNGGHRSGQSPGSHASCVVSVLPPMAVSVTGFTSERNPVDEPSRRFEWSSQYHAPFRVASNSGLSRRCFPLNELGPASVDNYAVQRIETEENLCAPLGPPGCQPGRQSLCSTTWIHP